MNLENENLDPQNTPSPDNATPEEPMRTLEQTQEALNQNTVPPQPGAPYPNEVPQQPGMPYPGDAPQYTPYETPQPEPKKSGNKKIIAIVAVVCVVLAGIAAFAITGMNKKGNGGDSEVYLQGAMDKTTANIEAPNSSYTIDNSKFDGKPTSSDFSFTLDPSTMAMLGGMRTEGVLSGSLKLDNEQQKMLLGLDVSAGFISFTGNQLYVSPDLVGFMIPALYSQYITIDPNTFTEDYENSVYYSPYNALPENFDLHEIIVTMFSMDSAGDSTGDSTAGMPDYMKSFADSTSASWSAFEGTAKFAYEGSVTEKINGVDQKVDKMTYTYSADAMKKLYLEWLNAFGDYMVEYMSISGAASSSYYSPEQAADEMVRVLSQVEFKDPLVVRYTINDKQLITGIETEKYTVSVTDDSGDTVTADVVMKIDLLGKKNLLDDAKMQIDMTVDNETASFILSSSAKDENGTLSGALTLEMLIPDSEPVTMLVKGDWTPKKSEDNFNLAFEMTDGRETYGVKLAGALIDSSTEVVLKDGVLAVYQDNSNLLELKMSFRQYVVDAAALLPDLAGSISLFDLSEEDLYGMIS